MIAHVWGHLRRSSNNAICAFRCLRCLSNQGSSTKSGVLEHVTNQHHIELPEEDTDFIDLRPQHRMEYLEQWTLCFPEIDESSMDSQSIEEVCLRQVGRSRRFDQL